MKTYTVDGRIEADGHLKLDVATGLPESNARVTVLVEPAGDESPPANRHSFEGIWGKGLWMAEDFDAELTDFEEYMG